jgi:surface antigen
MQTDGNLVEYGPNGAMWSSRTYGSGSSDRAVMQGDGNFVVYNPSNAPLYHTGTYNNPGTYLIVQDDGNVVLYGSGRALFATSWHETRGSSTTSGDAASPGWCTYYAYQRFHQDTGIWPYFAGDAGAWNDYAQAHGWRVQSQPAAHSIVVFEPSGPGSVGHVGWVTAAWPVSGGWKVQVDEMNYDGSATVATGHTRSWTYDNTSSMSYIMAPEL